MHCGVSETFQHYFSHDFYCMSNCGEKGLIHCHSMVYLLTSHLDMYSNWLAHIRCTNLLIYFTCIIVTYRKRTTSTITCATMNVNMSSPRDLIVIIDDQTIRIDSPLTFVFKENPTFTSVSPQKTILR